MGLFMSSMGGGYAASKASNFLMGTLSNRFARNDIKDFESFHMAILEMFTTLNASLPGKHVDAPSREDVQKFFEDWEKTDKNKRKEIFIEFMKKNVTHSKVDTSMMLTGIVAPPAAMVAKRSGENVPQLKVLKVIPDVAFVPSATILAIVGVKMSSMIFARKSPS